MLSDPTSRPVFSVTSIWEVVIKSGLGRGDFAVDVHALHQGLLAAGHEEPPILSRHTFVIRSLPSLHKDPFDRLLVSQARVEGLDLWTVDKAMVAYGSPVKRAR